VLEEAAAQDREEIQSDQCEQFDALFGLYRVVIPFVCHTHRIQLDLHIYTTFDYYRIASVQDLFVCILESVYLHNLHLQVYKQY
jgi:hypothetical protein